MDIDDETSGESNEVGSDELLSEDNLRLPESANILVRVHAVRAWLARRREEAAIQVGEAALQLQQLAMEEPREPRMRRRAQQLLTERREQAQQALTDAQERLRAYEEAQALLEECLTHNNGERVLVEYYLLLEEQVNGELPSRNQNEEAALVEQPAHSPAWLKAIADVQNRIERVGIPSEEE
ncbi:MAG TPA: hypothetical protein VFA09_07745 [Ktedonobacteraceae bacterium]|jgi:hypothetical protein|nr:hypothetical protein [Ktedonobacteraceae bacterium]